MSVFNSDFFEAAHAELSADVPNAADQMKLLYTHYRVRGHHSHTLGGILEGEELQFSRKGPARGFNLTTGKLVYHKDREGDGFYQIIVIDSIEHDDRKVGLKTIKRMSKAVFAVVRRGLIEAEGHLGSLSLGHPEMFVDALIDVVSDSTFQRATHEGGRA